LVEQLACSPADLSGIHVGVHGKLTAGLIDFKHNWNEYRIAVIKNIIINENAFRISQVII
jgi:lipid II:glycine glycyltransferase (peptidoglycan interpeptide bridge formation enzyme)